MKNYLLILFFICTTTKSFSQYDTITFKLPLPYKDTLFRYCNGQKCNGIVIDTFENGKIKFKSFYNNGQLDGIETGYFQNGNIRAIEKYDMGKFIGTWFYYYENGNINAEYNYEYSNDKSSKSITYYLNGIIETKEEFTKDFDLLYYYSFNEKGDTTYKCIPIDFKKKIYEFISYYDNGLIEYSGQIQEKTEEGQKKIGIWKWYDEKGQLIKEEKKSK